MGTAVTGDLNPFLDTANWQGVDDGLVAGSHNLAESGAIVNFVKPINDIVFGHVDTIEQVIPVDSFQTGAIYADINNSQFGATNSTEHYNRTGYIDISTYRQKINAKIILTLPCDTSSTYTKFGVVFYARNNQYSVITNGATCILQKTSNGVDIVEIPIPSNANYLRTTFWPDTTYGAFSLKAQYSEPVSPLIDTLELDDVTPAGSQTTELDVALKLKDLNNPSTKKTLDTIALPSATKNKAGLMSASDKENLDRISGVTDSVSVAVLDDIDISRNLIATKDFKLPMAYLTSGTINKVGNTRNGNLVMYTPVGAEADWQNFITAFVKVSDIKDRIGLDISDTSVTNYIDIEMKNVDSSWIALRYGVNDKAEFDKGNTLDVVFNNRLEISGLGTGDSSTWSEATSTGVEEVNKQISNLKIPYTYNQKNLYAILVCAIASDLSVGLNDISLNIHDVSKQKSIAFYIDNNSKLNDELNILNQTVLQAEDTYYAACGDSITNANHADVDDISNDDLYMPIDGYSQVSTYKRKCYAYYVAKRNNLKWANYGWGGTTLTHCAPKAYGDCHGFVDDRITQMKAGIDWNYISIFFGWNDVVFGPIYQRDLWLQETYSEDIGYPVTDGQIGTTGFATQAQKDACDAAIGTVGGVYYDNADDYFFARFLGTIDSNDKNTWYGAYNYALTYLMTHYLNSKIVIVAPYLNDPNKQLIINAVLQIGAKFGVNVFNFEDVPYWPWKITANTTPLANPNTHNGRWPNGIGYDTPANVNGYERAQYLRDDTHPTNLGYKMMSHPFEKTLIFG